MAERARLAGALASLALLAPFAVLATSAPASAERAVLTDPAGDVVRTVVTDDGEMDSVFDTADAGTDVRRLSVRHAARTLTMTMRVRDLERGQRGRSANFGIETAGSRTAMAMVDVGRTPARDRARVMDFSEEGEMRTCRGVDHAVSARRDTITVTIPRRCLGNPRWVRVSGTVFKFPRGNGSFVPLRGKDPLPAGQSAAGQFAMSQDDAGADARRAFAVPRQTRRVHVG